MSGNKLSVMVGMRDDGYTVKTRIVAVPNMFGELNIIRRPTTVDARAMFLERTDGKKDVYLCQQAAKFMASKIIEWDAQYDDGSPVPIDDRTVSALHPHLFTRLRSIICYCIDGGDGYESDEKSDDVSSISDEQFIAKTQGN